MFLELVATFAAGFAAAGIVLTLNKVLGGRLPKWFMPVAAGAAMLAATISSEYSWFPRTKGSLPEGLEIVQIVEGKALYRPWTYAKPFIERFVAVDTASVNTHDKQPQMRLGDLYFFGRWAPVNKIAVLADCASRRRAALIDGVLFNEDGSVDGVEWVTAVAEDPVLNVMCGD